MTICIVEQGITTALEIVDRVYLIDHGEIIHEDTAESLRDDEELLNRHLGVAIGE